MIVAISIIYMVLVAMFICVIISAHKERDKKARAITERSDRNMVGITFDDNGKKYVVTKVDRSYCGDYSNVIVFVEEYKEKEE